MTSRRRHGVLAGRVGAGDADAGCDSAGDQWRDSWFPAADILQMTPRNLRRWRERYERWGYNGLVDQRRCPSKRRVPMAELERVLQLYRERYAGFNGRHFHEIVRREHGVTLSYSYVKQALQQAGLLPRRRPRGRHRRRREPRACFGELLHLDGSRHPWLALVPDGAGHAHHHCRRCDQRAALRAAVGAGNDAGRDERRSPTSFAPTACRWRSTPIGPAGRFFTPKATGPVDKTRFTQVGRALAPAGHRTHSGLLAAGARPQ